MSSPGADEVSRLCGLGPRSSEMLARVGIHTAADLLRADAFAVYARLKREQPGVSLNLLYALLGAQEGRHWQEVLRDRRTEILMRLDDLGLAPGRRRVRERG